MRKLAKKMRTETEELEEDMVDVRREDKTIRKFNIPVQEDLSGAVAEIKSVKIIKKHEAADKTFERKIGRTDHILVSGPNGIGKSTFLRALAAGKDGAKITSGVKLGYYSQDFATLDFNETVFDSLKNSMADGIDVPEMRSIAAGFLVNGEMMGNKISELSEGQKGLVSFARLVLMKPGILILDEPTNHINFRHLPVIAEAINDYEGAVVIVSHMEDFVKQLRIDDYFEFGKL